MRESYGPSPQPAETSGDESDNHGISNNPANEVPRPRLARAGSFSSEMALRASEAVARAVAAHRAKEEIKQRANQSLVAAIGDAPKAV